jgi:hypothetical protein
VAAIGNRVEDLGLNRILQARQAEELEFLLRLVGRTRNGGARDVGASPTKSSTSLIFRC